MAIRALVVCLLFSFSAFADIWGSEPLNYRIKRFHKGQFASQIDQKVRDFIVLLPENYDSNTEVEIIFFLSGGDGYANGVADALEMQASQLRSAYYQNKLWVAVGMENYGMWSNNTKEKSSDIFLEFVAYFESHVKHSGKRNLVGHSLGGAGAFHMAFEYGEKFDGIAAVSAPILMWNVFDATPEMIEDYIKTYAPTVPVEYFSEVVNQMKVDFGSREAFAYFDFYNRIQYKILPKCFGFFMGGKDPMGFNYLAHQFLDFAISKGKSIPYFEQENRKHEFGEAVTSVATFFQSCE